MIKLKITCLLALTSLTYLGQTQPYLLSDINAGNNHSFPPGLPSTEIQMLTFEGNIYFITDDGLHGSELWKSDGTPTGSILLKDINPGLAGGNISNITIHQGKLYFSANDGTLGAELWVSDGTEEGTHIFKDIRVGPSGTDPQNLTVMGNTLYFSGNKSNTTSSFWRCDGTESGTLEFASGILGPTAPRQLTVMGDKIYFAGPGGELWSTDGTDSGTVKVKEIAPGGLQPYIDHLTALDGRLYFKAEDQTLNDEPWVSDGTAEGTVKLKEISPDIEGSNPWNFHFFKGHVYFSANGKLWRTDGTPAGTALFKDLTVFQASNDPARFFSDADFLYFPADDGVHGKELWRSDGTAAGTILLKDISPGFLSSAPQGFTAGSDGSIYFQASQNGLGAELWHTDATASLVADLRPGPGHSEPQAFRTLGGALYFVAADGLHGRELWKLDLVTGVQDPEGEEALFFAGPNPAGDALHLSIASRFFGENCRLRLYNAVGQPQPGIPATVSQPEIILSTGHLPAGLYFLEMTAGHRSRVQKIQIVR